MKQLPYGIKTNEDMDAVKRSNKVMAEIELQSGARYYKQYDSALEAELDTFKTHLEVCPVVKMVLKKL